MQLLDYLELKGQTVTEFAGEVHARLVEKFGDPRSLEAAQTRVWRHAHGKRNPKATERAVYEELTKGAVTSHDWDELALRQSNPPPDGAPAEPVAASG